MLYSCLVYSQDEKLRIEIIDVFKEYAPVINNSVKISDQPVFNDTLKHNVILKSNILNKNISLKENLIINKPDKFRLKINNPDYNKYFSLALGSKSFIDNKFHYTNGISTIHNSGFYFNHQSEEFLVNKDYDGYQNLSFNIYTNRYIKKNIFKTSFTLNNNQGFYWGDLNQIQLDSISKFNVSDVSIKLELSQPSNSYVVKNVGVFTNYLVNNYNRNEFIINPFLFLSLEKALKKYSFKFNLNWIKTNFKDLPNSTSNNPNYNQLSIVEYEDNFTDLLLNSSFCISGDNYFNYEIGFNFQYFPGDNLNFGGQPLLFPQLHLLKKISDTQIIQLNINKELKYHSFNSLFDFTPYLDPFYRNSLSKEFKINLLYNKLFTDKLSLVSNFNYLMKKGELIPFIFYEREETLIDFPQSEYQTEYINPLGMYLDPIQTGLNATFSISFDQNRYNVLFESEFNLINSKEHHKKYFIPRYKLNSIITMGLFEKINLTFNWFFVGNHDALIIEPAYNYNSALNYINLNKYIDGNISLSYDLNPMIFSMEIKNILGNKIEFFDHYYDDNGFKISLRFLYKF